MLTGGRCTCTVPTRYDGETVVACVWHACNTDMICHCCVWVCNHTSCLPLIWYCVIVQVCVLGES